jgi:hypothetical protein
MNNPDFFEKLKTEIEAIPANQVLQPQIPIDVFNQSAENLYYWALDDKDQLMARGLKAEILDMLIERVGASRHAQALWYKERHAKQEAEREWREKSPGGYKLRNLLLSEFEFAFYADPALMSRVDEARKGSGHSDMIQDLTDLSLLGKENILLLEGTNFDSPLLDTAIQQSDELAKILAIANGEKAEDSQAKLTRDKAYTFLKELVDEVRRVGKFVFRDNPERIEGYEISYYKKHR